MSLKGVVAQIALVALIVGTVIIFRRPPSPPQPPPKPQLGDDISTMEAHCLLKQGLWRVVGALGDDTGADQPKPLYMCISSDGQPVPIGW